MMDIQKLTKDQAVIISGFTGILCGDFSDFHADVEKRLGRGIQTFQLADKMFWIETIKPLYASDFIEIGTIELKAAKTQAPEDFVLVPKELSDKDADEQAMFSWCFNLDIFKSQNRDMTAIQVEQYRLRWCLNKARSLQQEYRNMIEAQDQSNA